MIDAGVRATAVVGIALIHVIARETVAIEDKSRVAKALEGSVVVGASLGTATIVGNALIHVVATMIVWSKLVSRIARASVGAL